MEGMKDDRKGQGKMGPAGFLVTDAQMGEQVVK